MLRAYALGVFPMADGRDVDTVYWVEPRKRGVLPLDGFHLSRSLKKAVASGRFRVTADRAFGEVVAACAAAAADRPETWINGPIERVFLRLHRAGHAHSIECWHDDRLVGGLYGLALGGAFFGESMFSRASDASKVALAWLVARLRVGNFRLLDCQFQTDHLRSLGTIEVPRATYSTLLSDALAASFSADGAADFRALDRFGTAGAASPTVSGPASGKDIVQLLGHTS